MSNNQSQYQQNIPYKIFNYFHEKSFSLLLKTQFYLIKSYLKHAHQMLLQNYFFFVRTLTFYLALNKSNLFNFLRTND